MYSALLSELVIPFDGKKMVEKMHGWERDYIVQFFLPTTLVCFICTCVHVSVHVSFFLAAENYLIIKSKSTVRENCPIYKYIPAEFL